MQGQAALEIYLEYFDTFRLLEQRPCTLLHLPLAQYHPRLSSPAARRYNFDVRKGPVKVEWFVGAKTSIAYNCVDRHVEAGHGDRVAFYWEGNDLNEQSVTTYKQLQEQVSPRQCARHAPPQPGMSQLMAP